MYTTLEEAKEEVWRRWNDAELRQRVLAFAAELPEVLLREPLAIIFRQLATPNFEFLRFSELAQEVDLNPLCLEYKSDKFCTRNPDKVFLGKMIFHNGTGRNGGSKTVSTKVIDFEDNDMKSFKEIKTVWKEEFIAFHHRIISQDLDHIQCKDNTAWFRKMGPKPSEYYHHFLSFFICHGILFENFLDDGDESVFTREIVRPAFHNISAHFGLKPLIVRLLPEETEADPYWCWYPGYLEAEVKALLAGGEATARRHAADGVTSGFTQNCNSAWK